MVLFKIVALTSLLSLAACLDSYSENLDLYQLPNGHFLSRFTFTFDYQYQPQESVTRADYMPLHFLNFFQSASGFT
jgi:hypothetical protein